MTIDDLPQGWSTWPAEGRVLSDSDLCGAGDITNSVTLGGSETFAGFVQGAGGPIMVIKTIVFGSADTAKKLVAAARAALANCPGWTDENNGPYTTSELQTTEIGDETFALRARELQPTSQNDIAFVRKASKVVVVVINWQLEQPDPNLLEAVLRTALNKR
jgi:hypothetical protein